MSHLLTDLRSGVRMLVKYPMLSVVAVVTLGLGIGLSTTVFCVVDGALFKGLPFEGADRLVGVVGSSPAQNETRRPISVQDIAVYQARQTVFERFGAYAFAAINLIVDDGRPERYAAGQLTVSAFEALRVQPMLGRGFRAGDDVAGADPVMLISYDVWRDTFGRSNAILGKSVRASGVFRTIIGVMPEKFAFPIRERLWTPLVVDGAATPRGNGPDYQVIARLKDGVSVGEARTQMTTVAGQLAKDFPGTNKELGVDVKPYAETVLGSEEHAVLYTMLGAGIGVLLIACVNVSNVLVARASLRQKEVAVRMALGAARSRVVRQHLTEVLVLATAGGLIGILLSLAGMRWFTDALSVNPPPFWITFELDSRVLLFVAGLIVSASVLAGALPAWHAARISAGSVLKDDSRSSTSARLGKFSSALVVGELALSCGLLITAGLMIKSVVQLKTVKMPFTVDHILTARINLPRAQYPDDAACVRFYEQLLPKMQAMPGVDAATLSDGLPAAGNGAVPVQIEGRAYAESRDYPVVREGIVTPGYFETFQAVVLRGREFTPADDRTGPPVIIVNETFARTEFPNLDPMGRHVKRGRGDSKEPWLTVIGVVLDLLMQGFGNNNQTPAGYYIPIAQSNVTNLVSIAVRTRENVGAITGRVRSTVASLDADLAIYDVSTMAEVIKRQTWFYTVFGTFFMAFGSCALFLASAGLYGVMSFAVTQRTREMGVRSALGAQGGQLVRLVMTRSVIQLAIGLTLGLLLGLAAAGPLQPVLYNVNPRDPVVLLTVLAALIVSSLLASFLPAWRVTKIDPVVALAGE